MDYFNDPRKEASMAESINQARKEVQSAFDAALRWAETSENPSFGDFEQGLWSLLLALGRALVVLFLAHRVQRPRPTEYRYEGKQYRLDGERVSDLGTFFGKVAFSRPVGRRPDDGRAACDLPVDRELGLCSGFSLGVVTRVPWLAAQMAFASVRSTFQEIYEWAPSPRAVLRMVDAVGEHGRPFMEEAPAPEGDGEILVIQVDARGAPMISEEEHELRCRPHEGPSETSTSRQHRRQRRQARTRPRRTKGKKSKNSKCAVVGVLYTLKRTAKGVEGPINKRVYATFEGHEALFIWLRREADKRGYPRKRTVFLADGSEHIWQRQKRYFPEAEACVDWYHVVEYIWGAGECMFAEGSPELRAWVARQARSLRRGATKAVLDELRTMRRGIPKTGPGNKGKRKRLDDTIRYFQNNHGRMIYRELLRDDLDIGSGAVEGAVRNLIGMRLDGPGMRWSRQRSEMHLRCILLNGQWHEFCRYLATGRRVKLAAKPVPTIAHNAKKVA
jgi:hypothetical protein